MYNILRYQRKANEICFEILFSTSENAYSQFKKTVKQTIKYHVLSQIQGKENTYSFILGLQTCIATTKISVDIPLEARNNRSTKRYSYNNTLGNGPKVLYIVLQRYLVINIHYCSIHNSQIGNSIDGHQLMNG